MSHPPRDGILYTPVDSDSESELGTPSSMDECGTELAAAQRLSYHVRRARRHRPLLVTAFGGVLCFSLLLLTSFGAYTHLLSVARVQIYHPVDSVPGEGVAYGEGVALDDDDTHVLVPVRPLGLPPRLLTAPDRPPVDLLVDLYLHGVATSTDPSLHRPSQIDIVYLFVNASSPYFAAAKAAKAVEEGLGWISGDQKRYRDNGELRGAMRSGALALGDRVRRVHLLSGSFDFDGEVELPSEEILATKGLENVTHWRMAQVPHWLDWDNRDKLHYHTHDDVYRLPRDDDGSLHAALSGIDEKRWRSTALPTFNSFEIESRIGWMQGLSDNFVFSNDDMFLRHEQAVADFVHPILGNVVRAEPGFMVDPKLDPKLKSTSGEWGGLGNAATLIAGRFPSRPREYILHMPKGLSRSIAHEASVMFAQQLTTASTRTFRESTRGRADVEFAWLMTHLQIERWREALLWSFIVARVGGENGEWGPEARDELRAIGLDGRDNSTTIHRRPRATLNDMENIAANAGWEGPLRTTYMHSSFDGHWQDADSRGNLPTQCSFDYAECLPQDFFNTSTSHPADIVFKRMAFNSPACGNCLIDALVSASGPRGLAAFLPPNTTYSPPHKPPAQWDRDEPILPLTPTWDEADFSLASVVKAPADLREWCVKLLSRYAYVYGKTESRFFIVHDEHEMNRSTGIIAARPGLAMICINDDQPDRAGTGVRALFNTWMREEFGGYSQHVTWENGEW